MSQSTSERLSESLVEPMGQAYTQTKSYIREHPQRTIGGVLAIAALVALAIWGWPELRRTIQMHSM